MPKPKHKLIIGLSLFLFIVLKAHVIPMEIQGKHAWRQSQTALNIRNFVRQDANILNPRVAHYNLYEDNLNRKEFPLMQWSIAMIQRVFGENIALTRCIVLMISLFTLLAIYKLTLLLFGSKFWAANSIWLFGFSPVFFYQSVNPIPDNLALCMASFFLLYFFSYVSNNHKKDLIKASVFLSVAALCKLPFILFAIMPVIYLYKERNQLRNCLLAVVIILIPSALWYSWVIPSWHDTDVTKGILDSSIKLNDYLSFLSVQLKNTIPSVVINYPTTLLCLLGTLFFLKQKKWNETKILLLISAFLIFTLYFFFVLKQIKDGHDYYHYPFLPLYIILAIFSLKRISKLPKYGTALYYLFLLAMPIFCMDKVNAYWDIELSYTNEDFLRYRTELRDAVPDDARVIMINDGSYCIVPYAIDKQGYIFTDDKLPVAWIEDLIKRNNVKYLYSDSRIIESQDGFRDYVKDTIGNFASVHVYELKKPEDLIAK